MYSNIKKQPLFQPSNEDVCEVIREGLQQNFIESSCEVVQCPDLTNEPWGLAMKGLCGSPCIGEIGGVRYLCPIALKEKVYNLREIGKMVGFDDGLVLGAGAGPHPYVGKNSEMIANLQIGSALKNSSKIAKVDNDSASNCILEELPPDEVRCALLMNFFVCHGISGSVIKVTAKSRKGTDDFVGCMRKALLQHYGDRAVGLGGTFRMKTGMAKIHVMPDFSVTPLKTESEVNDWLKFFDMLGPMLFMSVFVSRDPGLEFRVEHSHGYNASQGGHYHYDVTPEEVEYEGYFSVAEHILRIDKP